MTVIGRDHNDILFPNHKQKIISSLISATVSSHLELEKTPSLTTSSKKIAILKSGSNIVGWRFRSRTCCILIVEKECPTAAIYGQLFTPPTRTEILESIRF